MSHYGKCKHGVYLDGCRKCFPLPELTKVGEEIIQELAECFNEDKEMTANELVDKLESVSIRLLGKETEQAGRAIILYRESAIMLQQQAKEIKELKNSLKLFDKELDLDDKEIELLHNKIEQQAKEIAMLKQIIDANNLQSDIGQFVRPIDEPVAWISVLALDHIGQKFTDVRISLTKTDVADIPLYTHPAKTLTDEEIKTIYYETGDLFDFARAILKRASEK